MRDPAKEHERTRGEQQTARLAALDSAAKAAATVLETPAGRELFAYLARKYHLRGRAFLSANTNSPACPYAAAVRDGEKAPIMHVYDLARIFDENIPIP